MISRLLLAVALLCAVSYGQVKVSPLLQPHQTFVDQAGAPCAGCALFSYTAGTTIATPTYQDAGGSIPNTNPIVLSVQGGANIWVDTSKSYKFVLKNTQGTTLWTVDNVQSPGGGGLPAGSLVNNPTGSQIIIQSPGTSFNVNILNGVFNPLGYGAVCDGVTNDRVAFQAAADAARDAQLVHGGNQTVISPPGNCVITGQVRLYTGTKMLGQGTITVPSQSGHTIYAENTDNVTVEGVRINVIAVTSANPTDSAIAWYSVAAGSTAHKGFAVRNSSVINSAWGILVNYNDGTAGGSLTDVDLSNNTITSNTVYTNADGIHISGAVHGITINGNRIYNRGDSAIGLTSEMVGTTMFRLSGATISNNVLLENLVGLDNSGGMDVLWTGNYVKATTPAAGQSNPAFRSISYPPSATGLAYSTGVQVIGNYFESGNSGTEYTAKIDPFIPGTTSWPALNTTFEKNVIAGPNPPLYVRGKGIVIGDNTFINGGMVNVNYGDAGVINTENVILNPNKWLAAGSIAFGGCFYTNVSLQPQYATAAMAYPNLGCITPQNFQVPQNFTADSVFASKLNSTSGNGFQMRTDAGSTDALLVQNSTGTQNLMIQLTNGDIEFPLGPMHWGTGLPISNSNLIPLLGTTTAGHAVCVKTAGTQNTLGICANQPNATGNCTCN